MLMMNEKSLCVQYSIQCMYFVYFQHSFHLLDCQNGWSAQFSHCPAESRHSIGYLQLYCSVGARIQLKSRSLCIISYIVWYQRGYQEFQEPRGTSVAKVKGVSSVSVKIPSSPSSRTDDWIILKMYIIYLNFSEPFTRCLGYNWVWPSTSSMHTFLLQ